MDAAARWERKHERDRLASTVEATAGTPQWEAWLAGMPAEVLQVMESRWVKKQSVHQIADLLQLTTYKVNKYLRIGMSAIRQAENPGQQEAAWAFLQAQDPVGANF